jgi:transcriptional regulator with XRE-family HTH domain
MSESDELESAHRALGARLATFRRAAGYSQIQLAGLVSYSRSTIANVETGHQRVPRSFWTAADSALGTDGALIAAADELEAARRQRELAAGPVSAALVPLARGPLLLSRGIPDGGQGDWRDGIAGAAARAREHAERLAVTGADAVTVEQITAEVARLSRAYVSAPPLPLFTAMQNSLGRIQSVLDGHVRPSQARDLHFLAGAVCSLMANATLDLGREEAADDLARAAWTYGEIIGHRPLMAWARGTQALAAIWNHEYHDAAQIAEDGLAAAQDGTGLVRLHAIRARALAAAGDFAQARSAIAAAAESSATRPGDDLHDGIGGEFAFDNAKLAYYQAVVLVDADDPADAVQAAETAIGLYEVAPARARSYGCETLSRVHLARAQLLTGSLDAAAEALGPVLALDARLRVGSITQHLDTVRHLLRVPPYRGSATARRLDQRLAAFGAASAAQVPRGGR